MTSVISLSCFHRRTYQAVEGMSFVNVRVLYVHIDSGPVRFNYETSVDPRMRDEFFELQWQAKDSCTCTKFGSLADLSCSLE